MLAITQAVGSQQITTVPLDKQADRGSDDPVSRRRAAQQNVAGGRHPAPYWVPNRRHPHRSQSTSTLPTRPAPNSI